MTNFNCNCDDEFPKETLKKLRIKMMRRLGFSAQVANPPTGMTELLNDFLSDAQTLVYEAYEELRTSRFFTWTTVAGERFYDFFANDESYVLLAPESGSSFVLGSGGAIGVGSYSHRISAVNALGESLADCVILTTVGSGAANRIALDWSANPRPGATVFRIYGRTAGSEELIDTVTSDVFTYIDDGTIAPGGALPTSNTTYECSKLLSSTKVEWIGMSDAGGRWFGLRRGIDPLVYSEDPGNTIPSLVDFRQCIEVWPPPEAGLKLRIKGEFGLLPFTADNHETTIDPMPVWLRAMANAKAHYRQPDAGNYANQELAYIEQLVASTHQGARYIPPDMRGYCEYHNGRFISTIVYGP